MKALLQYLDREKGSNLYATLFSGISSLTEEPLADKIADLEQAAAEEVPLTSNDVVIDLLKSTATTADIITVLNELIKRDANKNMI